MEKLKAHISNILPTTQGWCTIEKAHKLIDIVEESNPILLVELGVFGGKSLLPMAMATKQKGNNGKVIGIDAWAVPASLEGTNDEANDKWWANINYDDMFNYTTTLMQTHGVSNIVELWRTRSVDCASRFLDESIDVLHQDSNHSEEVTTAEVELYWSKVKKGGVWIFDDTNWPTTKSAQTLLLSKGYTEIKRFPGEGTEWTIYVRNST